MKKGKKNRVYANIIPAVAAILFLMITPPGYAHNMWIIGDADGKDNGAVHLYFEHHVGPGDGTFLGPIEARGKTWLTTPQDEKGKSIILAPVKKKDIKYLAGDIGQMYGSYALDHTSLYGIYHGRLDFFHGRYIDARSTADLAALSESTHLPVRIVPVLTDKGILLKVMYFSTPHPRANIYVLKRNGEEESFQANNKGEFLLGRLKPGVHYIAVRIIENEPAGAFEYQAFKGIMHVSTLALKIQETFGE